MDVTMTLINAVREGRLEATRELINIFGLSYSQAWSNGYLLLREATKNKHSEIAKLLLTSGSEVNIQRRTRDTTPLHFAVKNCDIEIVKMLLDKGATINAENDCRKTPLYYAIENEKIEVAQLLLTYGADVNNRDSDGISVLHVAVKIGCLQIVEALLEYGFNLNPEDAKNPELLHGTVERGYLKIVEDLLKYGADVNTYSNSQFEGFTPLHCAAKNKQGEVVKLLIRYKADVNAQDKTGKTPIFYAIENADLEMTKLLLTNKANIKDSPDLLHIAVQKECIEIVKVLLQYDADINASDKYGRTALHFTALSENEGFFRFSRDDPDFNIKGEIAELLLSKGANVDVKNKCGLTTLHAAVQNGYVKVVEALLKHNANVNSRVVELGDITPLHLSAKLGKVKITEMLLNKGANVNARQKDGITALHIASQNGHGDVVVTLLEYGSDINITSTNNQTALDYAIAGITFYYSPLNEYYSDGHYYDPAHSVRSSGFPVKTLIQHIVKLEAAGLYVSLKNIQSMHGMPVLEFYYECNEEIANMKKEKINGCNISFYDILKKNTKTLAIYLMNENLIQVLKSEDYKTKFPIFASLIKSHFRQGMERIELLEQGKKIYHFIFSNPELPHDCIEKIFSYLSNKDLRILIDVCKPLSISNYNTDKNDVVIASSSSQA